MPARHETRPWIWIRPRWAMCLSMEAYSHLVPLYRELIRERAWSRIHLVPLLLAEGDRDTYRREQAALAREKEIMKDVKGWQAS